MNQLTCVQCSKCLRQAHGTVGDGVATTHNYHALAKKLRTNCTEENCVGRMDLYIKRTSHSHVMKEAV